MDNLSYKTIFVDFDNTLCLHRYPINYASKSALFSSTDVAEKIWFRNSIPYQELIDKLSQLQQNGVKIILLTSSGTKQLAAKKIWLNRHASNLHFDIIQAVSVDCSKAQYISAYIKYNHLETKECLMIDDCPSTINEIYRDRICDTITPVLFTMVEFATA